MGRSASLWLLALLGIYAAVRTAYADFPGAMKDYADGRYEAAHDQFLTLAALGDVPSQFNLGAMSMQGQGVPRDLAMAAGWLAAAADNGSRRLARQKLADLRSKLTDEQRKIADDILKRYGRAGLLATVLPVPPFNTVCPGVAPPKLLQEPPEGIHLGAIHVGFVAVEFTIGVDGLARDPKVLMAVPNADLVAPAVDKLMKSRWGSATKGGAAVEYRTSGYYLRSEVRQSSRGVVQGVVSDVLPELQAIRATALTGEPTAQYELGLAAALDSSLAIPPSQIQALLVSAAQGGDPRAQYWAASQFMNLGGCGAAEQRKGDPWLRAAARSGDGAAQLTLAGDLIRGQPAAEQLAEARSLLEQAAQSTDFYVAKHVAALLAASPLEPLRDPHTAQALAVRLVKTPIDSDPQAYEAAAAAYAANGDFGEAAAWERRAIKKAALLNWNTALMEDRFSAYRRSQPWLGDLFSLPAAPNPAATR